MRQKMPSLKLFCGKNKGVIFTLDATIASVVVILVIIVSSVYISKSKEEALPKLQMLNTGYDIMNIITERDYWGSAANIETTINTFNPQHYDFIVKEQCGSATTWADLAKDPDTADYTIPTAETVVTGEYVFVKAGPTYCRARFYVWLKS